MATTKASVKLKNSQLIEMMAVKEQKFKLEKEKLENRIANLSNENAKLKKKLERLELQQVAVDEENDFVIRKILELKAKLHTVADIKKKLLHMNINKDISFVRSVTDNIELLDKKHQDFYDECITEFEEKADVSSSALKRSIFENTQMMRDNVSEDLMYCPQDDLVLKQKLREELMKLDKTLLELSKNIDVKEHIEEKNNIINDIKESYEKTKSFQKKSEINVDTNKLKII